MTSHRTVAGRPVASALVVSTDALIAALLGALVEQAGLVPRFAQAGESPLEAAEREHPLVVLVDCDDTDVCSELGVRRIAATGAATLLFGHSRSQAEVEETANLHGVPFFALPIERAAFVAAIRRVTPANAVPVVKRRSTP